MQTDDALLLWFVTIGVVVMLGVVMLAGLL
jgi:hypothetical protein